jgi:AraC family transcriptional regulator
LAKIAVEFQHSTRGPDVSEGAERPAARWLAQGEGWSVSEVVCHLGPRDRPFEEQHSRPAIAIVVAGTFQYRSGSGRELMTPGSLLLGSAGQYFECGHEHGAGDRCLSFSFTREFFEGLMASAGGRGAAHGFRALRLPPVRPLSPLVAQACAAIARPEDAPWEEIGIQLAAQAVQLDGEISPGPAAEQAGAVARVTRVVRMIEQHPDAAYDLGGLAREARLSRYHFLRVFESLTGVTPHQYLLRGRLRRAALRLSSETTRIVDIALDCGFGDISNFNRSFRREFRVNPRLYRAQTCRA